MRMEESEAEMQEIRVSGFKQRVIYKHPNETECSPNFGQVECMT